MNQPMNVSIPKPEVITIVCVTGYVKHHLYQLVDDIFADVASQLPQRERDLSGFGLHFYPVDDWGNHCTMVTNFSVPPTDDISYLWNDSFYDAQEQEVNITVTGSIHMNSEPVHFTHGGQEYRILMYMDGYEYESTSPEDDRYEN